MIIRNSAKCLVCNREIVSHFRHDYVSCLCGNLSIDGGKDYFKRSAEIPSMVKDTSEVVDD